MYNIILIRVKEKKDRHVFEKISSLNIDPLEIQIKNRKVKATLKEKRVALWSFNFEKAHTRKQYLFESFSE